MENKATTIILNEMHDTRPDVLTIPGYSFATHTISDSYGIATFVIDSAKWNKITFSQHGSDIEWAVAEVEGVNITNIYKPPGIPLVTESLPCHPSPYIYAIDFNCHSTTWGYSTTNLDRTTLEDWVSAHDLTVLLDPKQPRSFCSAIWGTRTNLDLAFTNMRLETTQRRVLTAFPKSQYRPSIIETSSTIKSVPTRPVKR